MRVAELGAGHDVEQRGGVGHGPGDRPDDAEPRTDVTAERAVADPSPAGLEPEQATAAGRDPDRTAAVAALGERSQTGRDRGRRTAARTPGPARAVPRRAGGRPDQGLGVAGQAELRRAGLAQADRAGRAHPADDVVVERRDEPGIDRAAVADRHALDVVQVLDRHRHAGQRRGQLAARGQRLLLAGLGQRQLRRHRDERAEPAIVSRDPVQEVLGDVDRGDVPGRDGPAEVERAQLMQLAHGCDPIETCAHRLSVMSTGPAPYPEAARLDIVERLPADQPTYDVADPYRWLEDAASEQTQAWSAAQDALFAAGQRRPGAAGSSCTRGWPSCWAPGSSVPRPGAASAQFLLRRLPAQEHAVLLTVDPDGTERVLVDPMAIDPSGDHDARRLAAEQGGRPARLPALRGRQRGVGPAGHGRASPARSSTARSTARATPPSRGRRRRGLLLRAPARPGRPARGRGAVPPPGLAAPGRHRPRAGRAGLRRRPGPDELLRRPSVVGRALAVRVLQLRHGARATMSGWPTCRSRARSSRTSSRSRAASTRRPRSSSAATAGPTSPPTATPRAAGWPSWTRPTRRTSTGST